MPPTPARADRTSAAILDAAARVFAEEGAEANLASVAAAAGIGRATLYRYFANREALLDALASHGVADLSRRLEDAALERTSVEEAVERIVRAVVTVGDRYAVLLSDHDRLKASLPPIIGPIRAVLDRGAEDGTLRDDLATETLSEFLSGAALTAIKLTQEGALGIEEASSVAAHLFLDGSRRRR